MLSKKIIAARRYISRSITVAIAASIVAVFSLSLQALADNCDDYNRALALFNARRYAEASRYFKRAVDRYPGEENWWYYYGLSCHYARDTQNAKLAYLECIQRFPGTMAAQNAQKALNTIAPGLLSSAAASPRSGGGSMSAGGTRSYSEPGGVAPGDVIPTASIVNFSNEDGHMVVDVAFNGRRTKAIFDTGAESVLLGKNHLAQLGIQPPPAGETKFVNRGADGRLEDLWPLKMDVTCGGVLRKNLTCHIKEHMDSLPLLGLPFVKGMNYAVESSSIRFSAKTGIASAGSTYNAVPYKMVGRSMVVQVKVNGRDVAMCLDTGAVGTLFTKNQAAAAGIDNADSPITNLGSGVGGGILGHYVNVNTMTLGPVTQRDYRVGVKESNDTDYPLLGKDFWEGHRFSVDDSRHIIQFN